MAVSYHNLTSKKSKAEVKIFSNTKTSNHNKPMGNKKIYELHSTVDNPHLDYVYTNAAGLPCGFAVVAMAFAEHESSHYLLMLFQLLDKQRERTISNQSDD